MVFPSAGLQHRVAMCSWEEKLPFSLVSTCITSHLQLCFSTYNWQTPHFPFLHRFPCTGGAFASHFRGRVWSRGGVGALALGQVKPCLISTMHQRLNCWPVWEMSNSWGAYQALLRLPSDNAGWKSLSHLIPFSLDVTRASHFLYPEKEHRPGIFCRTLLHADWDGCSPHKQIRYYVNV